MRIGILTREWPPEVYGGAGVHVEYLARELAKLVDVDVHAFGGAGATVHSPDPGLAGTNAALQTLSVDLRMAAAVSGCDVLHSHTWYADLAGHLGSMLHGVPHVVTTHSLEPHRPWKADQLGGGYQVSSWAERTALESAHAVIAVSHGMRTDVLEAYPQLDPAKVHVVHNGIDTAEYRPGARGGRARVARRRSRGALRAVRRAGSPTRRASSTCCGRRAPGRGSWSCAPGRRTRRRSSGRWPA